MSSIYFKTGAVLMVLVMAGPTWSQSSGGFTFDGIDVRGNTRLSDTEVLTSCGLDPSRTYQSADLNAAVQCLGESGAYQAVSLDTEGRTLIVNVQEAPQYTGLLDVSVTAEVERGLSARLYVEDRDLFDRGLRGTAEVEAAREEKTLALGLVNPDILGSGYEGGVALSYGQYTYDEAAYAFERLSFAPFLRVPLTKGQSITLSAGVQLDEIDDIDPATSPVLINEGGQRTSPFARIRYAGLFEPDVALPTRIGVDASQTFLGLGQDHLASITTARVRSVSELVPDRLSFALEASGGHIESLADDPSLVVDRFFLGGSGFRGFSQRGIGPVDGGQFLGGNSSFLVVAETNSPIGTLAGVDFSGGIFGNLGAVWNLDNTAGFTDPVDDEAKLRSAVGLSMTLQIGEVPLNLYYAHPVEKEDQDQTQDFGLEISTRF